ncbi:hypothetical protein QBC39DRAFT_395675 [Podospora conica]|nr:hypothetical protein QBC39DRAFT_395675 [Schizothecium conicum]
MPITITTHPDPPPPLLSLLESHLPHSLTLLRRLQFATRSPSTTSYILHATYTPDAPDTPETPNNTPTHFATAHLNLHASPETECLLYSSLESHCPLGLPANPDPTTTTAEIPLPPSEIESGTALVLALLRRIRRLEANLPATTQRSVGRGKMILGSVHEAVRQRLLGCGVRMGRTEASGGVAGEGGWGFCGKWLFEGAGGGELVGGGEVLGEGMCWDVVRRGDVGVVQARTAIPRLEATLLSLPSTVVRLGDGTPVAWAFLGLDGTLVTLHVEEPYRGKGLAKAVARRLMRDHLKDYGDDGWGAADVFVFNTKSQAVCKSLGGKLSWIVSW